MARIVLLLLAIAISSGVCVQSQSVDTLGYFWSSTFNGILGSGYATDDEALQNGWGSPGGDGGVAHDWQTLTNPTVFPIDDDQYSDWVPLGFSFYIGGNAYTQVRIADNGYLTFSPNPTAPHAYYSPLPIPTENGAVGNLNPIVAGWWVDLRRTADTTAVIQAETIGVAPRRRFVVQWLNVPYYAASAEGRTVTFQIQLFEDDGQYSSNVQVDYDLIGDLPLGATVAVGIAGASGIRGLAWIDVTVTAVPLSGGGYNNQAVRFSLDEALEGLATFPRDEAPVIASASGDPQFSGLQGQQFQVHGSAGEIFNLISAPQFSFNSRFAYLSSGVCNYNNTPCWTHPGTYLDDLGFLIGNERIRATADAHSNGLQLWLNDVLVQPAEASLAIKSVDDGSAYLLHPTNDRFVVRTRLFQVDVTNSDNFFNLRVMLLDDALLRAGSTAVVLDHAVISPSELSAYYPDAPLHGLIGQTWKNVKYADGLLYEGSIDDYIIGSQNVFDPAFPYSQFSHDDSSRIILP